MKTVKDLGRLIKKKYPGSYDDLSDEDVGRLVKAQYPGDYNDFEEIGLTAFDSSSDSDELTYLTSNLPSTRFDPKTEESLKPLLKYYNPSRGVFTAWWQRRKSEGRTSLAKQISEEYNEVIRQGALLEEEISRRKKALLSCGCL